MYTRLEFPSRLGLPFARTHALYMSSCVCAQHGLSLALRSLAEPRARRRAVAALVPVPPPPVPVPPPPTLQASAPLPAPLAARDLRRARRWVARGAAAWGEAG